MTGVFASALGYLVQTWAQRRTSATRTALAFSMEPVWTALFGFTLAGDRLGVLGLGRLRSDHGRDRRSPSRPPPELSPPGCGLPEKLDTIRLRFSQ